MGVQTLSLQHDVAYALQPSSRYLYLRTSTNKSNGLPLYTHEFQSLEGCHLWRGVAGKPNQKDDGLILQGTATVALEGKH
jgi:hypothetical protein